MSCGWHATCISTHHGDDDMADYITTCSCQANQICSICDLTPALRSTNMMLSLTPHDVLLFLAWNRPFTTEMTRRANMMNIISKATRAYVRCNRRRWSRNAFAWYTVGNLLLDAMNEATAETYEFIRARHADCVMMLNHVVSTSKRTHIGHVTLCCWGQPGSCKQPAIRDGRCKAHTPTEN